MWAIFRDPNTAFNDLDKYTIELVDDTDILAYQEAIHKRIGGRTFELHQDVFFIQQFFTSDDDVEYFARKYKTWSGTAASH